MELTHTPGSSEKLGKWAGGLATYLEVEKDASPLTIENYLADIRHFRDFMVQRKESFSWPQVTVLDIRSYLALMHDDKLARRTIARRISSLRSFTGISGGKTG